MSIGLRIKGLRKQKKLNQIELSSKLGVDNSQFSKIENGKLMPTIGHIMEICSIFNVSADWLLTGQGEMLRKEDSDPKDHISEVGNMVSLEEYKAQVKAATRLEIQLEQCQERVKALEKTVDQLKSAGSGVGRKELK